MPRITRIHETILYGADLDALAAFYAGVIGLRQIGRNASRSVSFRVDPESVLLLFNPAETRKPHELVPSHGATGPGHIAFTVPPGELDAWRDRLAELAVTIERETTWPRGGRSIYVRDPAGNSVEFIDGPVWPE